MADYWKSQDRKYCDFCKCWITDNKPSRDFHENGRRHKENVKKRIKTISIESANAHRESEKNDAAFRAMEAAALDAYRRDVQSNAAADLTSIAINKKLKDDNLTLASDDSNKLWHEAVSSDGRTYYWNTMTNETVWTPPPEGYLTLLQQKALKNKELSKKYKEVESYNKREESLRSQTEERQQMEERARLEREKLKARRVKEDTPPPVYGPIIEPDKNDPYGKWQKVETSVPVVDLQLPTPEYYECPVVAQPDSEPTVKEFKEKTLEKLDNTEGEGSFKKRKIVSGAKRNTRQRLDND